MADELWEELSKLGQRPGVKLAAVAYVSSAEALRFEAGDLLISDASDAAIKSRQTSAAVLYAAFQRGARIYSLEGLHAKIYAFGDIVAIGSANTSANSHRLYEAAILGDAPELISGVLQVIEGYRERATLCDETFFRRALSLPLSERSAVRGGRRDRSPLRVRAARTWLIGSPEDAPPYPGDREPEDARASVHQARLANGMEASWLWWRGRASHFRVNLRAGDRLITISRPKAESTSTRNVIVYLSVFVTEVRGEVNESLFTIHYVWDPDEPTLTFSKFSRLIKNSGWNTTLSLDSCREVPARVAEELFARTTVTMRYPTRSRRGAK